MIKGSNGDDIYEYSSKYSITCPKALVYGKVCDEMNHKEILKTRGYTIIEVSNKDDLSGVDYKIITKNGEKNANSKIVTNGEIAIQPKNVIRHVGKIEGKQYYYYTYSGPAYFITAYYNRKLYCIPIELINNLHLIFVGIYNNFSLSFKISNTIIIPSNLSYDILEMNAHSPFFCISF